MLRKRTRSVQKDQYRMNQPNVPGSGSELNPNCRSIFKRCHLFTGLSPKGLDSDSAKSPTSPLDFRVFPSLGNPVRSPRSSYNEGHSRNWDSSKVGLSIVDDLNDDDDNQLFGKVLRSSDSRASLFGPRKVAKNSNCPSRVTCFQGPQSLPKNYSIFPRPKTKSPINPGNSDVIFEIGESLLEYEPPRNYSRSLDSYRLFAPRSGFNGNSLYSSTTTESIASSRLGEECRGLEKYPLVKPCSISSGVACDNGFERPLSATEIELSEDYTCVISHGPNAKTTHIYGDCILECHSNYLSSSSVNEMEGLFLPPQTDFLSFCYSCHKKLKEGIDIYIYRGEKAFCSLTCRSQEILMDEELEKLMEKTPRASHVEC